MYISPSKRLKKKEKKVEATRDTRSSLYSMGTQRVRNDIKYAYIKIQICRLGSFSVCNGCMRWLSKLRQWQMVWGAQKRNP